MRNRKAAVVADIGQSVQDGVEGTNGSGETIKNCHICFGVIRRHKMALELPPFRRAEVILVAQDQPTVSDLLPERIPDEIVDRKE